MNYPVKNGNRTMNLMTKTVAKTLPPLGSTDGKKNVKAKVKFFLGSWTWFATEMDPETGRMFGKVFSDMCPEGELGYFDLNELASICNPFAIERDRYFKPTPLEECHG